jgi:hypothetical protein
VKTDLAIVTMTWARSPAEEEWLEKSLRALARLGLPIYVGEGGSNPEFVRRLERLPQVEVCRQEPDCKLSLVNQLRSAFSRACASEPGHVIYTEPDKRGFFGSGVRLLLKAAQAQANPRAEIIVAARTPASFATFPEGQQAAERIMNQLCGEAFGCEGDYTYGPMLISGRLLPYLQLIPEDLDWGWRFFLMAVAHQLGMQIRLCPVEGSCPAAQRGEDDGPSRAYRLRQLLQNVTGLANGWISLLDSPACSQPLETA